ncbi:hypothetical protein E2C01_071923 [Portunus trituberculatus]|uniref:Uncharacterized protein n=1 Tax=Portunus trituberculatus TaxID=210409 RepID=A0A5B7I6E9_PORTR|nr:hypothetical protein [Portunus trituberculatus]
MGRRFCRAGGGAALLRRCIAGVACDLVNLSVLMERMAQIAAAIAPCPVICARPLCQACPEPRPASPTLDSSPNVSDSLVWNERAIQGQAGSQGAYASFVWGSGAPVGHMLQERAPRESRERHGD